jgi:uncharacterized protein YkwD
MRAHALGGWILTCFMVVACGGESSEDDRADASSSTGGTDAAPGSSDPDDLYDELAPELRELFDLINEERAAHGSPPVSLQAALQCAAKVHCDDVCPQRLCQHEGTDGSQFFERIAACGGQYGAAGETIACGAQTARGAVDGWLGSPRHREIMLDGRYTSLGIAAENNFWVAVWAD